MLKKCMLFFCIFASGLHCANADAVKKTPPQKTILVFSSSGYTTSFVYTMVSLFEKEMQKKSAADVHLLYESLDVDALNGATLRERYNQWMLDKYENRKIDAVLAIGFPAIVYALQNRASFWPGSALIYVAATKDGMATLDVSSNATGISTDRSIRSFVELARKIFPSAQRLVLIGDVASKQDYRSYFATEVTDAAKILPIVDLRGERIEVVQQEIQRLPPSSVVYFTKFTDDNSGRVFASEPVLRLLAKSSNSPILVDNETWLGPGVIAASATDIAKRVESLVDITNKVLQAGSAANVRSLVQGDSIVFNWLELKHWGISAEDLPSGSAIRFYEKTFWEQYRLHIVGTVLMIVILVAFVVVLLVERKQRTLAVKRSRKYLGEIAHINRNTTATVYAAAIAHELNQPLAAIITNSDALELYLTTSPPAVAEAIDTSIDIRKDSQRASALIQRMRSMARKDENEFTLLNINEIIEDTLKFLAPEIKMRRARITTMFAATSLLVSGDAIQLQQVLTNLIINSLDAMSGMLPAQKKVEIETKINSSYVDISVSDSGKGFDANIAQVFESFFTTKSDGLGLGLAITSSIVENHGGHIQANNNESGGALVTFSLPITTKN